MSNTWYIGAAVGIATALIVLAILAKRNPKKYKNETDERQKNARAKAGTHAFLVLIALVFANGIYENFAHAFATPIQQSGILIGLSTIYYMVEVHLRGAYFGMSFDQKRGRVWGILALIWGINIGLQLFQLLTGQESFLQNGMLTHSTISLLIWLWCFILYALIYGFWMWNKRKEN